MMSGPKSNAACRGFTLLEMLIVVMILGICTTLGVQAVASFEANHRAERAARECNAAFRYARYLAMTTGKSAKVSFNTATNAFSVYWMSNGTTWDANPVSQTAAVGGTYAVDLDTQREIQGTRFTLNPSGVTTFIYNALGSCGSATTITFSFGDKSRQLVVPLVGDPTLN